MKRHTKVAKSHVFRTQVFLKIIPFNSNEFFKTYDLIILITKNDKTNLEISLDVRR